MKRFYLFATILCSTALASNGPAPPTLRTTLADTIIEAMSIVSEDARTNSPAATPSVNAFGHTLRYDGDRRASLGPIITTDRFVIESASFRRLLVKDAHPSFSNLAISSAPCFTVEKAESELQISAEGTEYTVRHGAVPESSIERHPWVSTEHAGKTAKLFFNANGCLVKVNIS